MSHARLTARPMPLPAPVTNAILLGSMFAPARIARAQGQARRPVLPSVRRGLLQGKQEEEDAIVCRVH
jgi:hypothetical protein